jgi:hypothetical protein
MFPAHFLQRLVSAVSANIQKEEFHVKEKDILACNSDTTEVSEREEGRRVVSAGWFGERIWKRQKKAMV